MAIADQNASAKTQVLAAFSHAGNTRQIHNGLIKFGFFFLSFASKIFIHK